MIAMINAGDRDAVLAANTMWACVSCYFCTTRCPQNIPITDIIYSLKRMSIAEAPRQNTDAPALAKTFTDFVEKYGRSFEFGLATGYHLLNRPMSMMKMGPMGLQMFTRGRMALRPTRIRRRQPASGDHQEGEGTERKGQSDGGLTTIGGNQS